MERREAKGKNGGGGAGWGEGGPGAVGSQMGCNVSTSDLHLLQPINSPRTPRPAANQRSASKIPTRHLWSGVSEDSVAMATTSLPE